MAERHPRLDVRLYLPHAIAATVSVVVIPIAVVAAVVLWADPNPPAVATASLGITVSLIAAVVGNLVWSKRPASVDLSFGELMIWGWVRRKRAEERLAHGEHLLGIDRTEDLPRVVRVDSEQQLVILKDLTDALESKDPYTHGHSRRVEGHVARTAQAMGLAGPDIEDLRKAASLHDVGKIRVPDRILRKQGLLTLDERVVLEDHVLVGAWMVSSVGNTDVVLGVRHHHERWDGSGYPNGLAGTDIPLFARIIGVADAYDAMTSSRPYRASLGRDYALYVIRAEAGRQFDPIVVEAFVSNLPTRIPAAALVPLLAGPQRFLRELTASFTRAGAGSIASAVGAAGAAAIIGAAALPSLEPTDREPTATLASPFIDTREPSPTEPPGRPKVSLKKPTRVDERDEAGKARAQARSQKKRAGGFKLALNEIVGPVASEEEPDVVQEPQPRPEGGEEPKPDKDEEPKPDRDEEPEPQPGKDEEPEPQPEPEDEEPEPQPEPEDDDPQPQPGEDEDDDGGVVLAGDSEDDDDSGSESGEDAGVEAGVDGGQVVDGDSG